MTSRRGLLSLCRANFNPHEREARDEREGGGRRAVEVILIHTSVKLVTPLRMRSPSTTAHFNPHEREARDSIPRVVAIAATILIHTSVKLVTFLL